MKAFADYKSNLAQKMISVFDRVVNSVQNGEKCWLPGIGKATSSRPFNSLPNNKNTDLSKLNAFADDNFIVIRMIEFVYR